MRVKRVDGCFGGTIMGALMSVKAMKRRYVGEWILIAVDRLDRDLRPVRGRVVAHSASRNVVYRKLRSLDVPALAIEYAGEIPESWAVAL